MITDCVLAVFHVALESPTHLIHIGKINGLYLIQCDIIMAVY